MREKLLHVLAIETVPYKYAGLTTLSQGGWCQLHLSGFPLAFIKNRWKLTCQGPLQGEGTVYLLGAMDEKLSIFKDLTAKLMHFMAFFDKNHIQLKKCFCSTLPFHQLYPRIFIYNWKGGFFCYHLCFCYIDTHTIKSYVPFCIYIMSHSTVLFF